MYQLVVTMCFNGLLLILIILTQLGSGIEWKHRVLLDSNFLLFWTPGKYEVTFELQVKTFGYIGFGFMHDDDHEGVDIVIGWVDNNGQIYLQDRYIKGVHREPQMDSSQDYYLQSGYENKTHTVLRFNRRYDTCDNRDLQITNDTMQLVWQYHVDEPSSPTGMLPKNGVVRGTRPLYLVQRDIQTWHYKFETLPYIWNIFNTQVRLPVDQDTLFQCRVFSLPPMLHKHHVFKYEPVIQPGNENYLLHMILYECRGDEIKLNEVKKNNGTNCSFIEVIRSQCNTIAISWSLGSEGFHYPLETGYSLDPNVGPTFFMLETHYTNPQLDSFITDNSGLRLFYTNTLRKHDAGVLSIGIDPNWRHIIPPGQLEVKSEGHCIGMCTGSAVPNIGISIFAIIMHTHQLGKKIKLRQIRNSKEMPPIVIDSSYDPHYQEYRRLQRPVKILPGDHLIVECTYSSKSRQTITLGGLALEEETCLVSVLYYPKIDLSLCYSLPALRTVLYSLGIDKLEGPSPLKIVSPLELKGITLEERLVTYNWEKNFQKFSIATRTGLFKSLCYNAKGMILPDSSFEHHYPPIFQTYQDTEVKCHRKFQYKKISMLLSENDDMRDTVSNISYAVQKEQLIHNKISRRSDASLTSDSIAIILFFIIITLR